MMSHAASRISSLVEMAYQHLHVHVAPVLDPDDSWQTKHCHMHYIYGQLRAAYYQADDVYEWACKANLSILCMVL